MEKSLEEIQQEIADKKEKMSSTSESEVPMVQTNATGGDISNVINDQVQDLFVQSIAENKDKVKELTDRAVTTELEIKNEEVTGRKEIKKSEIRKGVAKAKTEEDEAKHERAKTILKSQGLTSQLPTVYRITALIVGYPFYVLYLLTFGWIIQILTFVIKGFITMVADCAERFAEVNKKFVENGNEKQFSLGKAMVNVLKWTLVIGAITAIVVLFILK